MKIFSIFAILMISTLTSSLKPSGKDARQLLLTQLKRHHKKTKDPRDLFIIQILEATQMKGLVQISDAMWGKDMTGGRMALILPRDAPTMVINQMPMQQFRLNGQAQDDRGINYHDAYSIYRII